MNAWPTWQDRGRPKTAAAARLRVLYVVYWGAAEPLGQSLVVPAVKHLAARGVDLTLVTFEKPHDLARDHEMERIGHELRGQGVRWIPLRYHRRPKWPATLFDLVQGVTRGLLAAGAARPQVVHARTFVGGAMGLVLAPLLRAKLVYHNEGFYPDEQVDGGVWAQGSLAHRLASALEERMYARAHGIIALSHRARADLEARPAVRRRGTPVMVVPSCVDLDRFQLPPSPPPPPAVALRLVYVGSVGGRYQLGWAGALAVAARRRLGSIYLRILTATPPATVAAILDGSGLPRACWSVDRVPYSAMPAALARHHAGLFLLARGRSAHGCSPTKIGEYWATGLPVVTTPGVSDLDEILAREAVGVVMDPSPQGYERALDELLRLLQDPDLPARCRRAAQTHYALAPACGRQLRLYQELCGVD